MVWRDIEANNKPYAELLTDSVVTAVVDAFGGHRDLAIPLAALSLDARKQIPSDVIYLRTEAYPKIEIKPEDRYASLERRRYD